MSSRLDVGGGKSISFRIQKTELLTKLHHNLAVWFLGIINNMFGLWGAVVGMAIIEITQLLY